MSEPKQNYYGSLCTEMYEILHEKAGPKEPVVNDKCRTFIYECSK